MRVGQLKNAPMFLESRTWEGTRQAFLKLDGLLKQVLPRFGDKPGGNDKSHDLTFGALRRSGTGNFTGALLTSHAQNPRSHFP